MTACVACQEREPDLEARSQACARCGGRLRSALPQFPKLVDELHGLGFVERDTGLRVRVMPLYEGMHKSDVAEEGRPDPVAYFFPAGPAGSGWRESRIRGTRPERVPIQLDVTDLTAPARAGSVGVRTRGRWAAVPDGDPDQVGHLSVATVLDSWAREWAETRGERAPDLRTARERSPVAVLARWLADRLDWALREHPALDEFAGDVSRLLGALYGLAGLGPAAPKLMEAPCPACALLTLTQPFPEAYIECVCGRCLTPSEYEEYVMDMRHEITAVDVLTVLNGLERPKLDGLTFAVITKGYTESPGQGRAAGKLIQHEEHFSPFERGEIVVLNGNGREPFGEGRKPGKWSVEFEEFLTLAGALDCREALLKPAEGSAGSS